MVHERRTKIVCTLGPATQSPDAIAGLISAGMDVARLNFSHGTRDDHADIYGRVREASDAAGRAVSILVDLQGPKIRLGRFDGGYAVLEPGSVFTVTFLALRLTMVPMISVPSILVRTVGTNCSLMTLLGLMMLSSRSRAE